jgi:hypothetical protein
MKNVIGTFVGIYRSLFYYFVSQSYVAFCVSVTGGAENIMTSKNSGLNENRLFQEREIW